VDDRNHQLIKSTERHEALFGIVEAIVFVGIGGTVKDSRRVDEVEAVLFDIQFAFRITPREPHEIIVYTKRICVKELSSGLTNELTGRERTARQR